MSIDPRIDAVRRCPMGDNEADAATVGEYLGLLLSTLWLQEQGFDSKRPFGNSGWQYDVYHALVKNDFLSDVALDEDGFLDNFEQSHMVQADELILQVIRTLYSR